MPRLLTMSRYFVLGVMLAGCLGLSWTIGHAQEQPKDEAKPAVVPPAAPPDLEALEKEFERTMSGSVLVGQFTVVGKENAAPKEERYTISKVRKTEEGDWIFVYRYGDKDAVIPIRLKVEWAGDTPVITLTDFTIPGVGTFTARVLVYRGWYAGTWLHGDVGGHLYGKIEKLPEEKKAPKPDSDK